MRSLWSNYRHIWPWHHTQFPWSQRRRRYFRAVMCPSMVCSSSRVCVLGAYTSCFFLFLFFFFFYFLYVVFTLPFWYVLSARSVLLLSCEPTEIVGLFQGYRRVLFFFCRKRDNKIENVAEFLHQLLLKVYSPAVLVLMIKLSYLCLWISDHCTSLLSELALL